MSRSWIRAGAAAAALALVAAAPAAAGEAARPLPGLDPDIRATLVSVDVQDGELLQVFQALRDQANLSILFDEHVWLDSPASFQGRGRLAEVVPRLADELGLVARAYNPKTLLVFPDRPEKRWAYSPDNPTNAPEARIPGRCARQGLTFDAEDRPLSELLDRLSEAGGLRIRLDEAVDGQERVDFFTDPVTVQTALDLLVLKMGLTYKLEGRCRVLVYPHAPEKMFEHDDPRTAGLEPADFRPPWER